MEVIISELKEEFGIIAALMGTQLIQKSIRENGTANIRLLRELAICDA